jgi:transcriptional regulator with PAS, ATPase and Fis domain
MIVGETPTIREVRSQIARFAPTTSNVLITGESGTGKELVAWAIHAESPRRAHAFIPINCGAIPGSLIESQLFGHVKRASTSAVNANPGLFVAASGGTLFLDEVGELPLPLQVKLLRAIEDREIWPVGGTAPVRVDVRLVAATNHDLAQDVAAGRFREDLFDRLRVAHIRLPSLRERRSGIPLLAGALIQRLNAKLGTRRMAIDPEALRHLMQFPWNGNVRELEAVLERAMIRGSGDAIRAEDLPEEVGAPRRTTPGHLTLREAVRDFERQHILAVLATTRFSKREAARLLGISLASLYRKLEDLSEIPTQNSRM